MTKLNLSGRICTVLLLLATTAIGSSAQTFTTLHNFDGSDGQTPAAGLVQATNAFTPFAPPGSEGCCKKSITVVDSNRTYIQFLRPLSDIDHNCFGEAVLRTHSVTIPEKLDEA
jgi:hypothetical protein